MPDRLFQRPAVVPDDGINCVRRDTSVVYRFVDGCAGLHVFFGSFPHLRQVTNGMPMEWRASTAAMPGNKMYLRDLSFAWYQLGISGHAGIIPLGGFCIDPLYRGRLLVGLYNLSSTPFPLMPGRKMIAAIFYQLEEGEVDMFCRPEESFEDFPPDLIRMMHSYRPISTQSLIDKIDKLEEQIALINKQHEKREEWFEKFQLSLEKMEKSIIELSQALKEESKSRSESDRYLEKRFTDAYDKVNDTILKITRENLKTSATVGAIGAIIITILLLVVKHYLLP